MPPPTEPILLERPLYTPHQGAYFAHWLTLKGNHEDELSRTLSSARVDMNPHQVEAALFALQAPAQSGAILADEVGLGKTVEAALVIAQHRAATQRRILLITPATLRKQWQQELADKFQLDSRIVEAKGFDANSPANPFTTDDRIVIVSYEFASRKAEILKRVDWNLVVFDEAHRLRNVWKKDGAKQAKALSEALSGKKKIMLTATPLQNSLMELYGLISVLDPYFFGGPEAFRAQYAGRAEPKALADLRHRIRHIYTRTLRKDVQQEGGVNFTRRFSITQDFTPSQDEIELYERVSDWLGKPDLRAFAPGARHLVTLVIRKILASSSQAITGTLETIVVRLERQQQVAEEALAEDYETLGDLDEEQEEGLDAGSAGPSVTALEEEIQELRSCLELARSIRQNAKGQALLEALGKAFEMTERFHGPRKAVIFTESRRTQDYLFGLLEANGYAGQVILLNGSNTDPASQALYRDWRERWQGTARISGSKTADMKAAIVDAFRDQKTILLSTESGAEGINLQFCSLLINYDLPWNPQRIEQRIGRVHRYGQKNDVVVVNFLNTENRADQLVLELLSAKFKLFDGLFGVSDEVLGAIESGLDIERRIADIYQQCRSPEAIEAAFAELQARLDEQITSREQAACRKLLDHFDPDVVRRLRARKAQLHDGLNRYQKMLRRFALAELIDAQPIEAGFHWQDACWALNWQESESAHCHVFRPDQGEGLAAIQRALIRPLHTSELEFSLDEAYAALTPRIGQGGWLAVERLSLQGVEQQDRLLIAAATDEGETLDHVAARQLIELPAREIARLEDASGSLLAHALETQRQTALAQAHQQNEAYFEQETEKLDRWAEDRRTTFKLEVEELDRRIKEAKRTMRGLVSLEDKLAAKRAIKTLEGERDDKLARFYEQKKRIAEEEDRLLSEIEARLKLEHQSQRLFTLRWRLRARSAS